MILTCQTQCPQRRVLLQCLRNRLCTVSSDLVVCFIHENKKSKKMNVSTKKSQRITSKQHTQHTNYISKQFTKSEIQLNTTQLKSSCKEEIEVEEKKSFSIEYDRNDMCLTQSSFSFFSSSSYTRMMRDRIESHERMRECVRDTYHANSIPSTSCSSSKPPQSHLHLCLRSC